MQNGHPTYTKEFKREAVRLMQTSGKSMSQLAKDLGISDSSLSRWSREFGTHGEQAFPGSGHQLPEQEEVRCPKRELEVVRMERDILKKRPCRKATPMSMKILPKRPRGILWRREALRSRQTQWSRKPDKKAG